MRERSAGFVAYSCAVLALLYAGFSLAAAPLVEVYGKLPAIERPRLSPDGKSLAFLSSVGGRRCLVIRKLNFEESNRGICPGNYEVRWFAWKNADRLILELYTAGDKVAAELRTNSQLVAVDANGRHSVPLAESRAAHAVDFGDSQLIDMLPGDPAHVLISVYRSDADSPDVVKVDINSGRTHTVITGHDRITVWKTDPLGQVRLGTAVQDGSVRIFYRDDAQWPFRIIREIPAAQASTFSVLALGDRPGLIYVASTEQTGRRAIYPYDVATDRFMEAYASNDQVDIDSVILDHGQPVGYSYTIDEREIVYTDPVFQSDAAQVASALPDYRTAIIDSIAGGGQLLILAAGGNRPGRYYLLTRSKEQATLTPVGDVHPGIDEAALAPVRPVVYTARDGLRIHGYVTLPPGVSKGPIPFVVLPHGGPSSRDAIGFDYLAQMIASRGYGVFQPNYRGSRGYGGAFEQAGFQQWGLAMQDDVTDGAHWLIDRKLADPQRICIVGWSYGGYAALMGAVKTPDLYRCAVSMAGVTDLRRRLDRIGQSRFADLNLPRFDSDPAAIIANSPVLQADRIHIPIMLAHGRRDFTVPVEDSEAMEAALIKLGKPVRTLYFDADDHYLYREEDRIAFLNALDGFLAENLGLGSGAMMGSSVVN